MDVGDNLVDKKHQIRSILWSVSSIWCCVKVLEGFHLGGNLHQGEITQGTFNFKDSGGFKGQKSLKVFYYHQK